MTVPLIQLRNEWASFPALTRAFEEKFPDYLVELARVSNLDLGLVNLPVIEIRDSSGRLTAHFVPAKAVFGAYIPLGILAAAVSRPESRTVESPSSWRVDVENQDDTDELVFVLSYESEEFVGVVEILSAAFRRHKLTLVRVALSQALRLPVANLLNDQGELVAQFVPALHADIGQIPKELLENAASRAAKRIGS
ncbi:MAG: hypothetical protein UY72_C0022G0009 [Candidatus Uhrbacteria bacterium GW2011_GWD2_52_7]|uniref:Uncharacterized protein n=1 Tax=Candidatus Uhrbacteria bacterium GW2011_GWD2_52_7 TaxID=1618989 RepID=A0A0G1XGV2_9BACT|nr:MAG: hypothetical protein UY72_C0022G0009 [Candidatus Uhrbacteria bacterium GW2011_GWD2_52_7]